MIKTIFRSLRNLIKAGFNKPVSPEEMFAKVRDQQNKKRQQRERRLKVQEKISNAWKNCQKEILVIIVSLNFWMAIQSRIKLDEQFSGVQENVSTVKTEIANVKTEMANVRTEMVKVKTQVERDTGIEGTVRRVKEAALGILVTGVTLKIGHVITKYSINQYYTLSNENKILTEKNVALQKELQNYGEGKTYKVSPNTISMEAFETVLTEKPGNTLPDHSFKIGLVNFLAEQVDFFDPTSEMTVSVKGTDLTFQQKVQMVLRNLKEQAKQKNYAWGEKLRQFQTVKVGGITITVSGQLDLLNGSSGLSEAIKHRPDTTKTKSNQEEPFSESFVKPKEKKRYAIKIKVLAGNITHPRNLDDYESAEQAKASSLLKYKNPSNYFGDIGATAAILHEQFIEIDENGDERPLTDQEMDEIIKDHKRETQREKQNDSDDKAENDSEDKSKNDSDKSFISLSTNNSQEYYESMKSKSSPSLMRIRLGGGDHIVISSGPDRRVDHISKEKLG